MCDRSHTWCGHLRYVWADLFIRTQHITEKHWKKPHRYWPLENQSYLFWSWFRGYLSPENHERLKKLHAFCKPSIKLKVFKENMQYLLVARNLNGWILVIWNLHFVEIIYGVGFPPLCNHWWYYVEQYPNLSTTFSLIVSIFWF